MRASSELKEQAPGRVRDADFVMVGSYVPQGVAVGEWVTSDRGGVTAFYDIDTPVTLAKLDRGDTEYLSAALLSCDTTCICRSPEVRLWIG